MDAFTIFAAVMYSMLIMTAVLAALTPNKRPLSQLFRADNHPSNESKHRTAESDEDGSGDSDSMDIYLASRPLIAQRR